MKQYHHELVMQNNNQLNETLNELAKDRWELQWIRYVEINNEAYYDIVMQRDVIETINKNVPELEAQPLSEFFSGNIRGK